MVQNEQGYLCRELAITSGTSQTTNQYMLTQATRTRPGPYGLSTLEGSRDIGMDRLYLRVAVTESFNETATTLDVVPTIASTNNMLEAYPTSISIEHYRARLIGAALRRGAVWHFPLRPISAAEVLDEGTGAPIWPTPLAFIGAKFIVTGTAFGSGKVTCNITPYVSPDAFQSIGTQLIPPKIPLAGW